MLVLNTAEWNCTALKSNLFARLLTILSFPVPELRTFLAKRVPFTERYPAFTSVTEILNIAFPCFPFPFRVHSRGNFRFSQKGLWKIQVSWLNSANSESELHFALILLVLLCYCPPCPLLSPQRPSTLLHCPNSPAVTLPLTFSNSRSQTLRCKNSWN